MTDWNRRDFMKCTAAGTLALSLPLSATARRGGRKPNIIFIMVDDMGIGDVGCYGQKLIHTSQMDKMAEEGTRFTDCYTGSPVCAPCRCILMTGLHSGHCRRRGNKVKAHANDMDAKKGLLPLAKTDFTVAAMLKKAGYVTGGFGKWGLGNPGTTGTPDKHGFDTFYGYLDQVHAHTYYTDHLYRDSKREDIPPGKDGKQPYSHHLIADETLKFIRKNKDRPFFCYVPWTPPHGRFEIPSQGIYADKKWTEKQKNYAAMVTLLDTDLGRLLDLLKELKIDEHTIVFFTSDNGPNKQWLQHFDSSGPYRGVKRQLYEGGIRMPMIVRWPGKVPAGKTSDFAWTFADFMATAAELAGTEPPKKTDSMSVLPTLLGRKQEPHKHLYWEFYSPFHQAVRIGNFKGVRYGTKEPIELYDLASDPGEKKDIAEKHPKICKQMAAIMRSEHADTPYWPTHERRKAKGGKRKRKGKD